MNSAGAQQTDDEKKDGCSTCNLEEIETLTCKAKRFGQQASVMNEVAGDLTTYRQQYADARGKYTPARDAAVLDLAAIQAILDETWETIRCRITDTQKECMTQSSTEVFDDIAACSDPPGCHSPCVDSDPGDVETMEDIAKLAADIASRRSNLDDSKVYFAALIAEPDTIATRVAQLKADATTLESDVRAGGDSSQIVSLYARWLILKHWASLDRIGHGFASTAAYLDCLCGVLRCLVSGWTHVAVLEGRKAELECFATGKETACEKKKADTLHAILDLFEECCGPDDSSTTAEPPAQGTTDAGEGAKTGA